MEVLLRDISLAKKVKSYAKRQRFSQERDLAMKK
jgi:hypothetical protein